MGNALNSLVGKPEGKGPLDRPKRTWWYNIKLYFREYCERVKTGLQLVWDMVHAVMFVWFRNKLGIA
jgi:hypothetical protein